MSPSSGVWLPLPKMIRTFSDEASVYYTEIDDFKSESTHEKLWRQGD